MRTGAFLVKFDRMSEAKREVMLSLKVMINKEKSKVVFAQGDNHFVDILFSFLTLPLGRIFKILERQYGNKAPTIGSLSNLYHSFTNLDAAQFMNKDAKDNLLNPANCFANEYDMLKVDINDLSSDECSYCPVHHRSRLFMHDYDPTKSCRSCKAYRIRGYGNMYAQTAATSCDGAFTLPQTSFIISEDLQIFPNDKGLFGVIAFLGITDMDEAEPITVNFGFTEIMKLLKASLTSSTPLSDVILNKTTPLNQSAAVESQRKVVKEENPKSSGNFVSLKVMRQKSTGKFLYAEAQEKFIDFLFGLFLIPLGGTEQLVAGEPCFKAINNLRRSVSQGIDCKYFKTRDMKNRLMKVNRPHQNPNGQQRSYLSGSRTYEVTDDLTVRPFCMCSIMSTLKRQKILISDVEEVELQIGWEKGLSILKASFTSTTALSDALLTHAHIPNKRPKIKV